MPHVPHKFDFEHREKLCDPWRKEHLAPEAIWRQAGLSEGMTVADVGAGLGFFAVPAAQIVGPAGKVYAIDTSPMMLCELERLLPPGLTRNIDSVHSEEYITGLMDECCRIALMAFVAHEVEDPPRLISEVARIIAPGGRLLLLDWDPGVEPPPGPPTNSRLKPSKVKMALSEAGFERVVKSEAAPGVYQFLATKTPDGVYSA